MKNCHLKRRGNSLLDNQELWQYALLTIGMLISCAIPYFGSLVIVTVIYAVKCLMIERRYQITSGSTSVLQNSKEE